MVISGHPIRGFAEALPMPSAYFSLILRGYGKTAGDRSSLLERTGVREGALAESSGEITLGQQLRQIRNANRILEPGWPLAIGASFHPATHGPVGFGAVSAPTIQKSLEVMTRFSQVRAPHFRLSNSIEGNEIRLIPEEHVQLVEEERKALLDIVMLSTQGLIESMLGRPMKEGRFEFSYTAPDYARRYADYFHAPVSFGHCQPAVVLPFEWTRLECPLADPIMYEAAIRSLAAGERRLDGERFVAARLEQLIASRGERIGLDAAARLMRVSRRTLARRLRETGSGYREMIQASRRSRAESLLRDRELNIAEVAHAMGYEDPANFGRACRRWFGVSPGNYRNRLLGAR
jgi:AraC-like DNA-binding protein